MLSEIWLLSICYESETSLNVRLEVRADYAHEIGAYEVPVPTAP